MNLTEKEKSMLRVIAETAKSFSGGIDKSVWTDVLTDNYANEKDLAVIGKGKSISGLISQLSQKGLVICTSDGNDKIVFLTNEGIETYNKIICCR
jgi:hypothetical protein